MSNKLSKIGIIKRGSLAYKVVANTEKLYQKCNNKKSCKLLLRAGKGIGYLFLIDFAYDVVSNLIFEDDNAFYYYCHTKLIDNKCHNNYSHIYTINYNKCSASDNYNKRCYFTASDLEMLEKCVENKQVEQYQSQDYIYVCRIDKTTLFQDCVKIRTRFAGFLIAIKDLPLCLNSRSYYVSTGAVSQQDFQNLKQQFSNTSDKSIKSIQIVPVDPTNVNNIDSEITADDFDYLEVKECYRVENDNSCQIICIDNKANEYRYSCSSASTTSNNNNDIDDTDLNVLDSNKLRNVDAKIDKNLYSDKDFNIFEALYDYANNLSFVKSLKQYNPFSSMGIGGCCRFEAVVFNSTISLDFCKYEDLFDTISNILVFITYILSIIIIIRKL